MGANGWSVCPKCNSENKKIQQDIKNSYGLIPQEEYEEKKNLIEPIGEEFRENYEFCMTKDGIFTVDYYGCCEKCGFIYEFKTKEKING